MISSYVLGGLTQDIKFLNFLILIRTINCHRVLGEMRVQNC